MCLQESLLLPTTNLNVPGFHSIRSDIISPGVRDLCLLVRKDFRFSLIDLNNLFHPSVELQAILLYCSLDSPVLIINLYRRPKFKTLHFYFYSNLFAATAYKYSLILGNFNAHHHVWGDTRVDGQGDAIVRASDAHNLIVLNNGSPTFISFSGYASSTMEFASCLP